MTDETKIIDNEEANETKHQDQGGIWQRGFFMVVFAIFFGFAQTLLVISAIVQFVSLLLTKEPNQTVTNFGEDLSLWFRQVARFQTTASDIMPFPWARWGEHFGLDDKTAD